MTTEPPARKYEFRTSPYEHQRQALRASWRRKFFALLMEMGTGKSKVTVDEIAMFWEWGFIDCAVIMAPKGVYMNWVEKEFPAHMPERIKPTIIEWRPGGGSKAHQRALAGLLLPGPRLRILVINTEALQSGDRGETYLRKFLQSGRCYFAWDESTFGRNPDSARTKAALRLAPLAAFRRILTGSPGDVLDLWAQFEFLEPGCLGSRNFFAYRARYSILKKAPFTFKRKGADGKLYDTNKKAIIVVGHRNIDDLHERVMRHSFRVMKEDCLDLPPKVYTTRDVELTPEQQRLYSELVENSIAQFENEQEQSGFVSATNVLTKLLRLQQIVCGHVVDDDGTERDVPTNRIQEVMNVLAEASSKVIIWSRFRRDTAKLVEVIGKEYGAGSVAQFHGGNTDTRGAEARAWLEDPAVKYMISNQQSGGYGNTWLPGRLVIYYSNSFSLEHRMQSEDRPHRSGQTERVTYIDLVSRRTTDEKVLKALRAGMDIAAAITGDGWRQWVV